MAGVPRDTYTFTYAGGTYGVKLPQNYYSNIDNLCGFTKASDSAVKGKFILDVRTALKYGALVEIGILYKKGNRLQRSKILCNVANVAQAIQELKDKTYRGYEIRSAFFTQRRRLG